VELGCSVIAWLESQRTEVIALLTFAASYVAVALVLLVASALGRRPIAADLRATTPVMLTPLSVIAGLLIAFLAARVWGNLDRANAAVAEEVNAIRQAVLLADRLPADTRAALRTAITAHLRFVQAEDWPSMAANQASLHRSPADLSHALQMVLAFEPTEAGERIAQEHIVAAFERALEGRRNRILLSQAIISPIQWLVIIILGLLLLVTIAMVHIERRGTAAINMGILATGIAACLVLLLVHDRPFGAGGYTVQPAALREISLGD
jgi:hypothetical protein